MLSPRMRFEKPSPKGVNSITHSFQPWKVIQKHPVPIHQGYAMMMLLSKLHYTGSNPQSQRTSICRIACLQSLFSRLSSTKTRMSGSVTAAIGAMLLESFSNMSARGTGTSRMVLNMLLAIGHGHSHSPPPSLSQNALETLLEVIPSVTL